MTLPKGAASARLRRLLAISATISIGGLGVAALYHLLSSWVIVAALAVTSVDFVVIFANDFGALRYAGASASVTSTLLASFCGYAFGNFIGFSALSGGACVTASTALPGCPRTRLPASRSI